MFLFDSVKKAKVEFKSIVPNEARIYLCGPTVYDNAHLGHARSAIAFDLLRRVLKANSYNVIFVRNFTDIDDKIAKKCKETSKSPEEITSTYIANYLRDMEALGVMNANLEPKVSDNLESIFDMINKLLEKNIAYRASNGDIYMSVDKDDKYGCISSRSATDDTISRIGENDFKRDSRDFALWKIIDNDVAYQSPFGRGRPGWHIECSAMIEKHLAHKNAPYSIDIHAGGSDLLFPHHENEASQSRCANNVELAKYWIHNGFVNINGEKMSKSLGNSFFIKDALKIYDGEILRYYLLSTHYRAPLHFSSEDLLSSKKRLDRLYRFKQRLGLMEEAEIDFTFRDKFLGALNDDMNVSVALSEVDSMISNYNEAMDKNPKDKILKQKAYSNLLYINEILGVGLKKAIDYFHLGVDENMRKYIDEQIQKRNEAKKQKDYVLSDKIRDELKEKNISLLDTKDGVIWEYNP